MLYDTRFRCQLLRLIVIDNSVRNQYVDVLTGMVELSQNGEPLFAPFVDESMELIDYVMEERVVS